MNVFRISAETIIEQAKDAFLSEDYLIAFNLIRESFEKEDLSNKDVSDLLNGFIGYSIVNNDDGENVMFSVDYIDADYKQEVSEVLIEQRTLKTINEELFMVTDYLPFDYNKLAETNNLISFLKKHNNSFVKKDDIPFKHTLSDRFWQFDDADYILIGEQGLYTYKENTQNIILHVSDTESDTDVIINRLDAYYR